MGRLHRLQEDILQRVLLAVEAPDLNAALARETVQVADFDGLGHDELEVPRVLLGDLAAEPADGLGEPALVIARLELEEPSVRAPLLLEIAVDRNAPVLEDQDLLAALFDVAEEMRGDDHMDRTVAPDL